MRRQIGVFIAQLLFFGTIQAFAQQTPGQQSPTIPDDVLGSQLIVWSQMQKPEPVLEPQSQEQHQSQRLNQPTILTQTSADGASTGRTEQDGNRFNPNVTNAVNRISDATAKH